MTKSLSCLLFVIWGALYVCAASKRMPNFPCTFSTRLVEYAEFNSSASIKDRIMATLMFSHNPQRRLAAQEALVKLKNGESVTGFQDTIRDSAYWYMLDDQYETVLMDQQNTSIYWNGTAGAATELVAFFDRFICAKLAYPDIPIPCPMPLPAEMKHEGYIPCPNHPNQFCDIWEGTYDSGDEVYNQTVYMVKDTNILDVFSYKSDDYFYRGDYVGMDTSKPDPSHFVPPTKYPCSDFTKVPSYANDQTWSSKKYPGKEFQLIPPSKKFSRASQPDQHFVAPKRSSRVAIPDSFDARKYWPKCDTIKEIRDQGYCGSCWAFGAAESFGDRYCIATGQSITFSPQYVIDCFDDNDGCNGGYPDLAWFDLMKKGIVSDKCKPYTGNDDKCTDTCDDQTSMKKYFAKNAYSPFAAFDINKTVSLIQEEIMANGPVEAAFFVFTDFMGYESGVYQRTSTDFEGGHAVKIIGWGVDKSTQIPYWLVANSWGEDWGEKGFFRIRRGTNECDIESEIATGLIKN